jgi:hypothetical protein
MALDDRERNFEKALGRQLRANAGAGLDCPDAETLAAYHERMLSTEEMGSLKSHIAACPSCQEILVTLEVTEAIPVQTKDSEEAFAGKPKAALSATDASPTLSTVAIDAVPATKSSSLREMPRPKSYLRWVAPAGAIAAGLLIWVAINENRPSPKMAPPASTPIEVAENRKTTRQEPAPSLADNVTEPKANLEERLRAENELHKQVRGLPETDKELRLERSRVSPNSAYQHGPAIAQNQVQNQIQNNGRVDQSQAYTYMVAPPAPPRTVSPLKNAPAAPATKSLAESAPPPPSPVTTGGGASNGVREEQKDQANEVAAQRVEVTGSEPAVSLDQKKNKVATQDADKLAVKGRSVQALAKLESGVAADASATASKEKQAAQAGRAQLEKADTGFVAGAMTSAVLRDGDEFWLSVVRTTNAKVFWVISREGEVFRSEDGGKSSRKQEIPAEIKAIAGSATDAKVCWILAEKSIAVRTANGGKHWTILNVPTSLVLTTITAQDAMHAVVSDTSGKVGYSTADGGATWNLVM